MRAEALKGHLDGLLLAALEGEPRHGYAIIQELQTRSHGEIDLPTGTIYPALHRLERAGLLGSDWTRTDGRRRRVYFLTGAGRRALGTERNRWAQFVSALDSALNAPTLPRHAGA